MKNFIIAVLILILIGAGVYIFSQKINFKKPVPQENPAVEVQKSVEETKTEEKLIGGDKDDHGCLIGAGYSWCEEKQKCLRVWEEECAESSENGITKALAKKYEKELGEVSIRISQEKGNCVRGGVEFAPGGMGNSGMFLAVKTDDEWKIAYDGNGAPNCEELVNKYTCPKETLTGLCD